MKETIKNIGRHTFFYKGPLSQWYGAFDGQDNGGFYHAGVYFNCAEQWMMHQKALLFDDESTAQTILQVLSPKAQQALGRLVANYDQELWDKNKLDIVIKGNLLKFSQNPKLFAFLVEECRDMFVEASPVDSVWGIGLAMTKVTEAHCDAANWEGLNLLGKALTTVRNTLLDYEYRL